MVGGEAELGIDPEHEDGNRFLKDMEFISFTELRERNVLPETLKKKLVEDVSTGFSPVPKYLPDLD